MKQITIIILAVSIIFGGCNSKQKEDERTITPISKDLSEIKQKGKLKVLISYSSTSYFVYRGQPMGFEYELLERLAKHLRLELDLVLVKDMDSVFHNINNGNADMLAYGLSITSDREEKVAFTDYLYLTSQVLVQKKPDNWRTMRWNKLQKNCIKMLLI